MRPLKRIMDLKAAFCGLFCCAVIMHFIGV